MLVGLILMILNYYNYYSMDEKEILKRVDCKISGGIKIKNIVDFFRDNGYEVESSIEHPKTVNGKCFETMERLENLLFQI